jgi:hypothetical protein
LQLLQLLLAVAMVDTLLTAHKLAAQEVQVVVEMVLSLL